MNPFATKLYPWQVAVARRTFVAYVTLPLVWSEAFWKTLAAVYRSY